MLPEAGVKLGRFEVWAQLFLCAHDCMRIREWLVSECRIKPNCVVRNMHVTVYHARRPIPGLLPAVEAAQIIVPTAETRFMVLAPGGENPRPDLEPRLRKVGIRVQRKNAARSQIEALRERLLRYETPRVLGGRSPSTRARNAFGARSFQPHLAMIRPGSGIDRDLTKLGALFRGAFESLLFDRLCIEIVVVAGDGTKTKVV